MIRAPYIQGGKGRSLLALAAVILLGLLCLRAGSVRADDETMVLQPQPLVLESQPADTPPVQEPQLPAPVTLEELESLVEAAPETLVAAAELEQWLLQLEREQAASGLKLFAGSGLGHYREAVSEDRTRDYDRARLSMGLSYPLLGTLARERINVLRAEEKTWEGRQLLRWAKRKALEALRSHYILLWASQNQQKLCQSFLDDQEQAESILQERKNDGLLLEADRQEFLTAFALVRRNLANLKATTHRAQEAIRLITRSPAGNLNALPPGLPAAVLDRTILRAAVVDRHPEVAILRGQIEEQLGVIALTDGAELHADLSVTGNMDYDRPSDQEGYGLSMQFTMQLPWNHAQAGKAGAEVEQARLKILQRKLEQVSGRLLADVEDALQRHAAAMENRNFALQRVRAATEGVREQVLRRDLLPGDTYEQLQRSRYQYYQAAMDYVDAESIELQAQARLLAFLEEEGQRQDGPRFDSVINEQYLKPLWDQGVPAPPEEIPILQPEKSKQKASAPGGLGVYVWNSESLLSGDAPWHRLEEDRIGTILLSFTRQQLDHLLTRAGEEEMRTFITNAKERQIRVGLLLGEPSWILPEHRQDLLKIINRLSGLPFALIHLDLEPNQLQEHGLTDAYLLAQLLRTVQAVRDSTALPVELSLHPRYLRAEESGFCLGCGLKNLNQVSVTLMIYVSNPERVVATIQQLQKEYPNLPFSLAQSVEPQLAREESHAGLTRQSFLGVLASLRHMNDKQLGTIYIQSWKDYMDLADEDQLQP